MKLKIDFNNDRVYWGVLAGALVLVLAALGAWAIPAYFRAQEAQSKYSDAVGEMRILEGKADIPSPSSLEDWKRFSAFLNGQVSSVEEDLFGKRTALIESWPMRLTPPVKPQEFEDAYNREVRERMAELQRRASRFENFENAFRTNYDWITDPRKEPDPRDYMTIMRDLWARKYFYDVLNKSDVRTIRSVAVSGLQSLNPPVPGFSALPIQAELIVAPEKVMDLIEKLMTVETPTGLPIFQPTEYYIEGSKAAGVATPVCILRIRGYYLLYHKPGTLPAPPAAAPRPAPAPVPMGDRG